MDILPTAVEGAVQAYLLLIGGVVGYAFVVNRLRKLTQPIRLKFAAEAEDLLALGSLTSREQRKVRFLLDNAFNGVMPWLLVILVPGYIAGEIFRRGGERHKVSAQDPGLRNRLYSIYGLWLLAVCGMSPLAGTLLIAELLIGGLIVMPLKEANAIGRTIEYLVSKRSEADHQMAVNGS